MVTSVMTSVPLSVWKVNAFVTVAVLPGATENGSGSVVEAVPRVVVEASAKVDIASKRKVTPKNLNIFLLRGVKKNKKSAILRQDKN